MQDELYESVRKYAARLLHNFDEAEDIAQEVFLRRSQHPDIVNPRAWVYRIARNLVMDVFRKRKKQGQSLDILSGNASLFDATHNPAALAERKENNEMLQTQFNQLPPEQREVLRLKFQEGLKYAEIAEVIGKPVTTVAWLIHTAVAALRSQLTA